MSEITIVHDDLIHWLEENLWLMQNGYQEPFHAIAGDAPYFLASIVNRFGGKDAAPAKQGKDGAFGRLSKGFMGKQWDGFEDVWAFQEWVRKWGSLMLQFVYPGAPIAIFGGSRTYHRVAAGLEDAGWEIFDSIMWLYGSGFPKAHTVATDFRNTRRGWVGDAVSNLAMQQIPLQERARLLKLERAFNGYKNVLKPGYEPIVLARAPKGKLNLREMAERFLTGSLNIDGTRIPYEGVVDPRTFGGAWKTDKAAQDVYEGGFSGEDQEVSVLGRYPANVVLSCACESDEHRPDCPIARLDDLGDRKAGGSLSGREPSSKTAGIYGGGFDRDHIFQSYDDSGSAARFFYTPKASQWERSAGLDEATGRQVTDGRLKVIDNAFQRGAKTRKNTHPTVKPIQLTTWLAKLLLPPAMGLERRILIPFSGSGSECIGARLAGWDTITGIEREAEYIQISEKRTHWWAGFTSYDAAKVEYDRLHPTTLSVMEKQEAAGQIALF